MKLDPVFEEIIADAKRIAKERGFESLEAAHRHYFPEKYPDSE